MNRLKNRHRIRAGKSLIIPLPTSYQVAKNNPYSSKISKRKLPDYSHKGYRKVVHHVAKGDTLWDISRQYGVKVSSLRRWNHQGRRAPIHPGQEIVVWLKKPTTPKRSQLTKHHEQDDLKNHIWYTVRPGDSLWEIAKRHKVTISQISKWNDIDARKPIRPGLRLRIYTALDAKAMAT